MRRLKGGPPDGRPARLRDVAEAAGVSTATVSRALTLPDRVRAETRARVVEAARRVAYTPNEAARALRAGASRMVLTLIPQRSSEAFFTVVLAGIDAELSARGYTMIMGSLEANEMKARRLCELAFARHLDGVIAVTPFIPTIGGRSILDAGIPFVSICAEIEGRRLPTVLVDDESCAAAQTEHLIGLGHRHLMYVAGMEGNYNEVLRYRGFLGAVRAARLDPRWTVRQPGDYSLASGVAAARTFLAMAKRPTGIVCCSDEMAIGFMKTVRDAGLRCPADVSVVGFDGIEFADYCEPTLTTIRQPRFELGASGARALLAALRGETPAHEHRTILPAPLVIGGSTACAPTTSPLRPTPPCV